MGVREFTGVSDLIADTTFDQPNLKFESANQTHKYVFADKLFLRSSPKLHIEHPTKGGFMKLYNFTTFFTVQPFF